MNKSVPPLLTTLVLAVLLGAGGCSFFGSSAAEEGAAASEEAPGLLAMDTFLTYINDPAGKHHAKLTVKLAITPLEKVDEIKADSLLMARLNDRILTLLTAKTFPELIGPQGKEVFRAEVRTELSGVIQGAEIKEVLFAEFVVQ